MIVPLMMVALLAHQSSGEFDDDFVNIYHRLLPIFDGGMDYNGDGEITVDEVLQFFRLRDNGDCQWTYSEFRGPMDAGHTGSVYTEERLRAIFTYYDTVGCTQESDGLLPCRDIPLLFSTADTDNNDKLSRSEAQLAALHFAQGMAFIVPTGSCPYSPGEQ